MRFFPDRGSRLAMHRQLAASLREAIVDGSLAAGSRLHPSRALAREIGVSRNTVTQALDQLVAEGYLETRLRTGTFVARAIARRVAAGAMTTEVVGADAPRSIPTAHAVPLVSTAAAAEGTAHTLFRPGVPDPALFPASRWRRVANRWLARGDAGLLGYNDPCGLRELREAIVSHVRQTRGVRAHADQVIVVDGTRAAIGLISRVLVPRGDVVALEDPGYHGAREVLGDMGGRLVGVALDGEGFDPARAPARARLAYVTPSHQYPTGAVMGLERRLDLLAWARRADAYVVEDDYDAEFRYDGAPLPALQGLDPERTIHLGTYSKTLAPALRVAWLIVPPALLEAFVRTRCILSGGPPSATQAALAALLDDGHFVRHLRRSTGRYRERRDALVAALDAAFGSAVRVSGARTGLHVVAEFRDIDDDALVRAGTVAGVVVVPLANYALAARPRGIVLGFATAEPAAIGRAVEALATALAARAGSGVR